ncbi:MAG: SHOCT domain-containing protein, partial [Anaerolineales bacterium]|nr:SHOCT domain-containing protein [Anaerolineales bacterium]
MYHGVAQMMWPMWGMGGMMWFWVLLIFGVGYWFLYGPRNYPRRRHQNRVNPLELARARLARGELTLEEFEE